MSTHWVKGIGWVLVAAVVGVGCESPSREAGPGKALATTDVDDPQEDGGDGIGSGEDGGPVLAEDCWDGEDNDLDGLVDCADDDCEDACVEDCEDGADNDEDSLVDCSDPDCDGVCPEDCDDGRDNDGDGLLDCLDDDCDGACPEDCDDERDNDGDARIDCADPDCDGGCAEVCDDLRDNDGDGLFDCFDDDCDGSCPEACDDGRDNDGDGLTDCEDGECVPTAVCQEDCTLGSGDEDLDGLSNCADDDCWGVSGCDGTTLWVAGGRGHQKVGSFVTSTARHYAGTSGTFTTYIQVGSGVGMHWALSSVSGFARVQSGTASQVCGWAVANAGVFGWHHSTRSMVTADVTSRSGFSSAGGCGLSSGMLAHSFLLGSGLSWRWQFSAGSSVVGWYAPALATTTGFSSTTVTGRSRMRWAGREADFVLGLGKPQTRP